MNKNANKLFKKMDQINGIIIRMDINKNKNYSGNL